MSLKIIPFHPSLAPEFSRLNRAWLEKYFEVEPIDDEMLANPQKYYLDTGGKISFAEWNDNQQPAAIVGTYALLKNDNNCYELSKMAVDESYQGKQIGHELLSHAIETAKSLQAEKIILFSHSKLSAAIHLYKKFGFNQIPVGNSAYKRSDVKMEIFL